MATVHQTVGLKQYAFPARYAFGEDSENQEKEKRIMICMI